MKVCSKCKKQKDLHEFGKDSHAKDGLRYSCRNVVINRREKKSEKK